MIKTCNNCDTEYDAKRDTSKYCSDKCRKLAFQEKDKVSVPEVSVPGRDDIYSPKFDMTEEGFIRRNKNWKDFPETWLERRRQDVRDLHAGIMTMLKTARQTPQTR